MNADRLRKVSEVIDYYEVDVEHGIVRSKFNNKPLSPTDERGYKRVNLWYRNSKKYWPFKQIRREKS